MRSFPQLKGSGVEKVIGAITALILLPVAVYTLWVGWQSWNDAALYAEANPWSQTPINGEFYRLAGEPKLTLPPPPHFPDIDKALSYRVEKQERVKERWTAIAGSEIAAKQDTVQVGSVTVDVNKHTRYSWAFAESFNEDQATATRWRIRYRPLVPEDASSWIVYATYQQGRLTDGNLNRMVIVTPDMEREILTGLSQSGRIKAYVLIGLSLILCFATFFILKTYTPATNVD